MPTKGSLANATSTASKSIINHNAVEIKILSDEKEVRFSVNDQQEAVEEQGKTGDSSLSYVFLTTILTTVYGFYGSFRRMGFLENRGVF